MTNRAWIELDSSIGHTIVYYLKVTARHEHYLHGDYRLNAYRSAYLNHD